MRLVVGLDLSMTRTGIGVITETSKGPRISTGVAVSTGKRADTLISRHERLTKLGAEILHHCPGPGVLPSQTCLAVVEGTITGMGGSALDRNALWWFVVGGLLRREIPVAVVAPTSVKLAITGSGKADKAAVAASMKDMWPDLVIGSSDVADAAGLAHLGAVALGWDVKTLARHKAVKWSDWPEFGLEGDVA